MGQMVNHKGYWCEAVQQGWKVKEFSCAATGQRETLIYPRMLYIPQGDIDDPACRVDMVDQTGTLVELERQERCKKIARERERSKQKSKCRHRIKSHDLCQLMTGTYRENMVDFDRARADRYAFERLMRKYIPGFKCVFAFEPQDRGAWHWHAAVHKMPVFIVFKGYRVRSYDFARRMWQRVVGHDNGTVNFDGHNKNKKKRHQDARSRSLAAIAGYVSKYLTKEHGEGLAGRNMWGSSKGLDQSKPTVTEISEPWPIEKLIQAAYFVPEGHRVARHAIGRYGEFWMLYTEPK